MLFNQDLSTSQLSSIREKALTWSKISGDRYIPRRVSLSVNDFHLHNIEQTTDLDEHSSLDSSFSSLLKLNLSDLDTEKTRGKFFKYGASKDNKNVIDALDELSNRNSKVFSRKKFALPQKPFKVLEAPNISDDFYHNIFDWSAGNMLGVNLDNNIYLLNAETGQHTKLYEAFECETVTSLKFNPAGDQIAMGNLLGQVSIWDLNTEKEIVNFDTHDNRVGAMDWKSTLISGSKDARIVQHDFRLQEAQVKTFVSHTQEVVNVKWSPDEQLFCSGGNDNKLFVWSPQSYIPIMKESHMACVKAIAWSERQYCVLASGGGSADKMIKTWNVKTRELIHERLTDSQICNLVFSRHTNDLISAQGFPNNEINIWRTNGLKKVGSLTGHTERVLYLNLSPCGTDLVSCAGDETLRFWKLYEGYDNTMVKKDDESSIISNIR